jgi:chromosome transmission fidelity protein 1
VLAGGTMKPISDFEQLIGDKSRIEYFSCDHVIPKENIFPFGLATSLNGIKFDFSYSSRDNTQILDELGNELINLCNIVPSGIVVFFVSYDYMDKVIGHFKKAKNNYILTKIAEKKTIFYEPKTSIECEKVFDHYTRIIKTSTNDKTGALLFAVIGGKMSEGINFSDDLGRCVIVVGQPYANIKSLELQEKMQYLNKTNELKLAKNAKQAGQIYYENLCWKAINQTIGRAIRHQNDYASIILIDSRYCSMTQENLNDKLPKWICEAFKKESKELTSKKLHEQLELFFKSKTN